MRELAQRLRRLIVATDDYRRAMAASVEVSTVEAAVLGELLHEGELSPTVIARSAGLTPGSATALIDRLVSLDLVAREPHPDDGRRILVALRPRGRAIIQTMFSLFATDLDEALRRSDPRLADDVELRRLVGDLLGNMASSLRSRAQDRRRIRAAIDAALARQPGRPGRPRIDRE
ncbi:MarR family winged helix-turn-helix transcriptional regulator [Actinomycetospora sp. C-140]